MEAVHWIIQRNQEDGWLVRSIAERLADDGHVPHLVTLERDVGIPALDDLPDDVPVVCYGPGFVTRAVNHPRLRPGLFFDSVKFRWSTYRANWGEAMLARDGCALTLAAAKDALADGSQAFVRPDADSKAFDGGLYDLAGLTRATEGAALAPSVEVVIARPLEVLAEWRLFIVDGEIVAGSEYRRWGRPSFDGTIPNAAIELAAAAASRWSPAGVYCLDLATTGDRIGIVEANCFNASRFYAADGDRILKTVNLYVASHHG